MSDVNLKLNFVIFIYILVKAYRLLFFLKIIFDQLPLYNQKQWPLTVLSFLVSPLIRFTQYYIPSFLLGPLDLAISFLVIIDLFEYSFELLDTLALYTAGL